MTPDTETLDPETEVQPQPAEERDSMDFDVVIVGAGPSVSLKRDQKSAPISCPVRS